MTKKLNRFEDWVPAKDGAALLSTKAGRFVNPGYLTKLAKSKKQPVRTQSLGYHKLYNREDLEQITIGKKKRGVL